jgi:hypothetical protein
MAHTHHYIDYVEIAVSDISAGKTFYADVFGWRFTDYGDAYAGIQAPDGDGEVGGLTTGSSPGTGGPLVLIISDDLDASQAAVTEAGGEVVETLDYPGGRRFHFRDPSGNVLGVFQPSEG